MIEWIPNAIAIGIAAWVVASLATLAYAHYAGADRLRARASKSLSYSGIAVLLGMAAIVVGVIVMALMTFGGSYD